MCGRVHKKEAVKSSGSITTKLQGFSIHKTSGLRIITGKSPINNNKTYNKLSQRYLSRRRRRTVATPLIHLQWAFCSFFPNKKKGNTNKQTANKKIEFGVCGHKTYLLSLHFKPIRRIYFISTPPRKQEKKRREIEEENPNHALVNRYI